MCWWKITEICSRLTGPGQPSSASGVPDTATKSPPADARSGSASANAPLTRWPGAVALGSTTESVASPAVEVTVAVVLAVYVRSAPGVNGPKAGGAPSVSESVAGTVPPTVPGAQAAWSGTSGSRTGAAARQ